MVTGTFETYNRAVGVTVDGKTYRTADEVRFIRGERKTFPDGRAGFDDASRADFKEGCQVALHGAVEQPDVEVVEGDRKPTKPVPVGPLVHSIRWLSEATDANVASVRVARARRDAVVMGRGPFHGGERLAVGPQVHQSSAGPLGTTAGATRPGK